MALIRRRAVIPLTLVVLGLLFITYQNQYQIRNTLSYSTRPLWDTADGPNNIIPHYYADGLEFGSDTCQLHGWQRRDQSNGLYVFDAVLMSSELDLLEIRMNELDAVVDRFFIVESNATFTGLPKETYFANNRARFAKFEHKISYTFLPGHHPLPPNRDAWAVEAETRNTMTRALRSHISTLPPNSKKLVIMADVDEIPSWQTVSLLKACDFGRSMHLQLRNYLYSFEWFLGFGSWRSSIQLWTPDIYYRHSKSSSNILADSGWHCSFCFRTIPEYAVKMKGFSHADRIGGRINLLQPSRIQETICKGRDIFGMLPEAYSYVDLITQMNLRPQTTAVGLPRFLLENARRFKFLLPGGCLREPSGGDDLE